MLFCLAQRPLWKILTKINGAVQKSTTATAKASCEVVCRTPGCIGGRPAIASEISGELLSTVFTDFHEAVAMQLGYP